MTVDYTYDMMAPHFDGGVIPLGDVNGWLFREGNDSTWADKNINTAGWQKLKPSELSEKLADRNGKLECWLRLKIKFDTSLQNTDLYFYITAWAATDVYVDGLLLHSYGSTGANGKPFQEYNFYHKLPVPFNIEKHGEHTLAIHFVDFISPLPPYGLKTTDLSDFPSIALPGFQTWYFDYVIMHHEFVRTILLTVNAILCMLFWFLAFQNRTEKILLLIALNSTVTTLLVYCDQSWELVSYNTNALLNLMLPILTSGTLILSLLIVLRTFRRKIDLFAKMIMGITVIYGIIKVFMFLHFDMTFLYLAEDLLYILAFAYYIIVSWKTLQGAQWAVLTGLLLTFLFFLCADIRAFMQNHSFVIDTILYFGMYLSFPLSLLAYVVMRFREIIKEVSDNAKQVVRLSEEKKEQALNQQKILQEEVNRQTIELRTSLENLKLTQAQLIQSEKMASLGELTAGIAHEIQNPLNFVNNFSEVN